MARTKGMLNLSGNLEVNAQAPLDARTIVPTEADLTVASNFPYPYVGLEVYVTGTNKKFRLTNLDTTQSSSWQEIGEGGGGETYSDFTGATSSTAGAHGLVPAPSAGDEGKVLFGNGTWGNIVMPSVDLSNSSVESDILDTTEKAVGTTTDGYLIYQKVVSTGGSVPSGATLLMRVQLLNNTDIIRYTKTTDSPLPSDVKFAGVDENGNTIYKKEIDFGSLPNNDTKRVAHNILSFDKAWIERAYAISANKTSIPLPLVNALNANYSVQIMLDSTDVIIITKEDQSSFHGYITIYYTKSS